MTREEAVKRAEACRKAVSDLEAARLTPFDLLSWTALLYLTDRTGDLDVQHAVESSMEDALHLKAVQLDAITETDFHATIAGERRR